MILTKYKEGIRAIRAIKYTKYLAGKYSRTRTFGAEVHKSNIRVKRWHNKYEISELDWKTWLNDMLTKSNHTEIRTYKVEDTLYI